ncbi:MAG: tRNA pseudouridine(38-40) synthase TruA [Candidatus Atribacteria bacterium]|nr:tRNA pseudouridine(38-40) synthase TruA [Candidatus Atribacteria bacterium]
MRNILLLMEYDGTEYSGWQIQPDRKSIQDVIEKTLSDILCHPIKVRASGRTDAGVHALGQVVNFPTCSALPLEIIQRAVNALLPHDIRILHLQEVSMDFDARKSAIRKKYVYYLYCGLHFPVFFRHYVTYGGRRSINLPLLSEALGIFTGIHDFTSFSASGSSSSDDPVREMTECTVQQQGKGLLCFSLEGSGFLYKMVRIILGEVWMVHNGKRSLNDLVWGLNHPGRTVNRYCMPPQGLYLVHLVYPGIAICRDTRRDWSLFPV